MNYEKTDPCNLCPFRNDSKRLIVEPERLEEFARGEFVCHKTAECREDGDQSGYYATEKSQHCAGLLIFLEHLEEPHQMMRICERLGMYDARKLNMNAPVFQSWEEVYEAA